MKTKIHTYKLWIAAVLLAMATLPSCEKELLSVSFEKAEPNTLSLKLFCSENEESRTADNMNNEDAVHCLDIFLYQADADFDDQAVYHKSINNLTSNGSHIISLDLDDVTIESLFGSDGNTCKIYVIANRPSSTALATGMTSVKKLKALNLEATFTNLPQSDFVMDSDFTNDNDGYDVVTLNRNERTLSGTVPLYRAASKISLVITEILNVPMTDNEGNEVTDDNGQQIVWTVIENGIRVRLHDGVKKSTIDNSVVPYRITKEDYFSFTSGNALSMIKPEGSSNWMHSPSFYSYSSDWGRTDEPDNEPYLTLIVPWSRSDVPNSYYNTYYQVPVNTLTKKLNRNHHYKIYLKVSRLGSFVEEKQEEITPSSYIILDWNTQQIAADLLDYRYLMVEEKNITIYNENELYIPYTTSHEAEIVTSTINFYQQDITGPNPVWKSIPSNNSNFYSNLELVGTGNNKQIYFKNVLDNVYTSSTFDFTPYKVTFTIRHKNNDNYKEEVTIIQYPAIYGEAEQNWDYSNDYNTNNGTITENTTNRDENNGFMFVNGYQNRNGNDNVDFFLSARGVQDLDANSYSPNMYIFTVTSVQGTDYVVGDPRETNITYNANSARWASAPSMTSTTRRELENYYGTENSERTRNMIAPKFRLASAYAVLYTEDDGAKNLENLRKRCASYQEDGYPAGRWRLPTEAEFKFIMTQVNRTPATLPPMYIKGYSYWCAHGIGQVQNNGSVKMSYVTSDNNKGYSTRCVYDEWYWTDKLETPAEKNVFTWGDQPR